MALFGAFLGAIAGPVAKRALLAIGVGVVSYAAVSTVVGQAIASARDAWGLLAGDTLALMQLAGLNTAASILAGAVTARVALQFASHLGFIR